MAGTKHTAGPWRAEKDGDFFEVFAGEGKRPICSMGLYPADDWPSEEALETIANGELIAAAPDLLAALKVASDELAVHHNKVANASIPDSYKATLIDRIEPIYDKINAAIARAEGSSHA